MNEKFEQTIQIIPVNQYGQCATGCTTEIRGALTPSIAKRLAGGGWHDVKGIDRKGALVTYKVRHSNVYKVVIVDAESMKAEQERIEEQIAENAKRDDEYFEYLKEDKRNAEEYAKAFDY